MHHLAPIIPILIMALIGVLCLLDRLLRWMERKGWIYYHKQSPKGTMRAGLSIMQELVQPEIRHVWEDQRQRSASTEKRNDRQPIE
ncbi:MAG TPA: hypothetical protein VHS31_16365 [Tepidisphaeraceae bacterium]|jgi:hypothetical protein|nr:hypothetical protein [Tepidisphaeraceae bacterium]